jgi:16S rRNA (uracil1498-N3)-methyltransferase
MKAAPWLLSVSGVLETGRTVVLEPTEARHLTGPLRRRPGDEIVLADGNGSVAEAKLVAIGKGKVEAEILSVRHEPEPKTGAVTLALAIIDNRAMDWAVQKAVEVGVGRFVPMEVERAQVRARDLGGRLEHWRRVALQALKQCRRPWAMEVTEVVPLAALVEGDSHQAGGVVADMDGHSIGELPMTAGNLLLVGPEGGLTAAEKQLLDRHGWPRLRLAPHVLRADTAAIVGGAVMVARSEQLREKS